jgi:hypothetical protein
MPSKAKTHFDLENRPDFIACAATPQDENLAFAALSGRDGRAAEEV